MDIGPISITTPESGLIRLLWIGTDILQDIPKISKSATDDVAFAAELFSRIIKEPKVTAAQVSSWGVPALEIIASTWAKHPFALARDLDPAAVLRSFRQHVVAHAAELMRRMDEQHRQLLASPAARAMNDAMRIQREIERTLAASSFARLVAEHQQMVRALQPYPEIAGIHKAIQAHASAIAASASQFRSSFEDALRAVEEQRQFVSNIFRNLPDPHEFLRRTGAINDGIAALDQSGYGFTGHIWDIPFVVELGKIRPGIRGAVATNRFSAMCRTSEFREELNTAVEATPVLRRRWTLISSALQAHARREYSLSIPVLLAQLEGCITDMLVLRGEAALYRGKLYARGADGNVKKNAKGARIKLTGLGSKLEHSRWKGDDVLESVAELMVDRLIAERNDILHGRKLTYPGAKLSTQCLLMIWVMAKEVNRVL